MHIFKTLFLILDFSNSLIMFAFNDILFLDSDNFFQGEFALKIKSI